MRAFITYVRPMVEYDSVIWSPSTVRDIETVLLNVYLDLETCLTTNV